MFLHFSIPVRELGDKKKRTSVSRNANIDLNINFHETQFSLAHRLLLAEIDLFTGSNVLLFCTTCAF